MATNFLHGIRNQQCYIRPMKNYKNKNVFAIQTVFNGKYLTKSPKDKFLTLTKNKFDENILWQIKN